jgi:hypothetical protein
MVCVGRSGRIDATHQVPQFADLGGGLSDLRSHHNFGRLDSGAWSSASGLALQCFHPNDKTNLAPYRVFDLAVIVLLVTRFLPDNWPGLQWRIFRPAILCGQQSLQTFATGIFLSFAVYFVLVETANAIWMQILLNVVGIAILTLLAWYRNWTTRMDKPRSLPEALAAPALGSSNVTGLAPSSGRFV